MEEEEESKEDFDEAKGDEGGSVLEDSADLKHPTASVSAPSQPLAKYEKSL